MTKSWNLLMGTFLSIPPSRLRWGWYLLSDTIQARWRDPQVPAPSKAGNSSIHKQSMERRSK